MIQSPEKTAIVSSTQTAVALYHLDPEIVKYASLTASQARTTVQ